LCIFIRAIDRKATKRVCPKRRDALGIVVDFSAEFLDYSRGIATGILIGYVWQEKL
jgi:hypothetical protein